MSKVVKCDIGSGIVMLLLGTVVALQAIIVWNAEGRGQEKQVPARNEKQAELIVQLGYSDDVSSVALSEDSKYLVTGGADHTAKLWEVRQS